MLFRSTPIGTARVKFDIVNKVVIEAKKKFEANVRGKYVDSCYCGSKISTKCLHLGRTYFPLLPVQIFPAFGKTEPSSATPIQFELRGGDQSYGDKLTLININKDVIETIQETVIVDEKDNGYASYSTVKRITGDYDGIVTNSLDRGIYTIGWRPSYMSYLADERNVIYKNLYNTWVLEGPPKVKFPPLEGVPNVFKNTVIHKGEYYYLDLIGDGQSDGDQIIFCHTGCNHPYAKSRPFQRENNRYPPIWIGDTKDNYGIWGISDEGTLAERLFICWRPAARTSYIEPEDDQWTPLEDFQRPGVNAYITINNVNADRFEIVKISLNPGDLLTGNSNDPVITPVLIQGDTLWFSTKPGICPKYISGGRVEIAHVVYNEIGRAHV